MLTGPNDPHFVAVQVLNTPGHPHRGGYGMVKYFCERAGYTLALEPGDPEWERFFVELLGEIELAYEDLSAEITRVELDPEIKRQLAIRDQQPAAAARMLLDGKLKPFPKELVQLNELALDHANAIKAILIFIGRWKDDSDPSR